MKYTVLVYFILCICSVVLSIYEYEEEESANGGNSIDNKGFRNSKQESKNNCWMTLNAAHHFKVMDEIDDRYAETRFAVQESLIANDFDQTMIKGIIKSGGKSLRELYLNHNLGSVIPSGLNLGGFCMLRMPDSVLFFHRMRLRNDTFFRIDFLENDIPNMEVKIRLSLNDLHLKGAYERSLTDRDPSILIYAPTFGEIEFLLKDVKYKMEGRYRLISSRLVMELISSEIIANDIMMMYLNQATQNQAVRVEKGNLGAFMSRLKTDLDKWLKDYFNDYLIYAAMDGIKHMDDLAKYDKEKESALEEYADSAIDDLVNRIRERNGDNIKLPVFTFKSVHGLKIKIFDGALRGLDSMYRRSVVTGFKQRGVRKVDCVIGFSNLKVVYKYEAVLRSGVPPLAGVFTLSADELTAHLALSMVDQPETFDLDIEFLDQMKPESLTVEGGANIMISNFRHLLEHQIIAIMSNNLIHGIRMLRTLPTCDPFFISGTNGNKFLEPAPKVHITTESSEFMTDLEQETVQPNSDQNILLDVNSQYKAALRSTKKPLTTPHVKESNKTKQMKRKLRNKYRKIKKTQKPGNK